MPETNAPNLPKHLAYCACDPCFRIIASDASPALCLKCRKSACSSDGLSCSAQPDALTDDVLASIPRPKVHTDAKWVRMTDAQCGARTECIEGARLDLGKGAAIELVRNVGNDWALLYFEGPDADEDCRLEEAPYLRDCFSDLEELIADWEEDQTRTHEI